MKNCARCEPARHPHSTKERGAAAEGGGTTSTLPVGPEKASMSKSRGVRKRLIAAALLSGACIAGAAAEDASVKEIKLEIVAPWKSEINITSSGGTRWDTILPNNVTVWAHMHVDTRWPGYVERVG